MVDGCESQLVTTITLRAIVGNRGCLVDVSSLTLILGVPQDVHRNGDGTITKMLEPKHKDYLCIIHAIHDGKTENTFAFGLCDYVQDVPLLVEVRSSLSVSNEIVGATGSIVSPSVGTGCLL